MIWKPNFTTFTFHQFPLDQAAVRCCACRLGVWFTKQLPLHRLGYLVEVFYACCLEDRVLEIVRLLGETARCVATEGTAGAVASQDGGQSCAGTGRKRLAVLHDNEER